MRRKPVMMRAPSLLLAVLLCACAPRFPAPKPAIATPQLVAGQGVVARDGALLPVQQWGADRSRATIIALHGMNDYANAFADPGTWLARHRLKIIAYDQRGFGRAPLQGRWAGEDNLVNDLDDVVAATRKSDPSARIYVLGESMGAAVAIAWAERTGGRDIDGLILSAPALWGWKTLNPLYRGVLSLSARLMPDRTYTGSGLEIWPSDNIDMLRGLGRDPLVIKATRADSIYGLVTLMDDAYTDARDVPDLPVLVLYGRNDQIIPKKPVIKAFDARGARQVEHTRFAYYPHGYHMLLRDLSREVVWRDILAWIGDSRGPLPSGFEIANIRRLSAD